MDVYRVDQRERHLSPLFDYVVTFPDVYCRRIDIARHWASHFPSAA